MLFCENPPTNSCRDLEHLTLYIKYIHRYIIKFRAYAADFILYILAVLRISSKREENKKVKKRNETNKKKKKPDDMYSHMEKEFFFILSSFQTTLFSTSMSFSLRSGHETPFHFSAVVNTQRRRRQRYVAENTRCASPSSFHLLTMRWPDRNLHMCLYSLYIHPHIHILERENFNGNSFN